MNFNSNDQAIIEQALKAAVANSADYQEITEYENVLAKIQQDSGSKSPAQKDGFRYDYDDNI